MNSEKFNITSYTTDDEMANFLSKSFKKSFPEITENVILKQLWFFRLLNNFIWKTINWLPSFLDKNWFEHKWSRLEIIDRWFYLSKEEKDNILKWNLFIAPKIFVYSKTDLEVQLYWVLATKKDNPIYSNLKSFFQDLSSKVLWTNTN